MIIFYNILGLCAKLLQLCLTLCNPMDCISPGSSVHGDSPGKNTEVGCRVLFWGIFLTNAFSEQRTENGHYCVSMKRNWVLPWSSKYYAVFWENAMAPQSSTVARKIPWMEEPGRLQSMGSLRVRNDWATSLSLSTFMHWRRKWQPTPVFLPGESHQRRSLVGCSPWGHTESDTTEVT